MTVGDLGTRLVINVYTGCVIENKSVAMWIPCGLSTEIQNTNCPKPTFTHTLLLEIHSKGLELKGHFMLDVKIG